MMPSLYWALFAGVTLLGAAAVLNMLFGRDLTRTRANLLAVQRLSAGLRRINDELKTKASAAELGRSSPPAGQPSSGVVVPPPIVSVRRQPSPADDGPRLASPLAVPSPPDQFVEPRPVSTVLGTSPAAAPAIVEAPSAPRASDLPPASEPPSPSPPRGTGRRRAVRSNE